MKKIVIFTGAGIGVPLGLPSTTDFIASVRAGWSPITKYVVEYLGSSGEDIEWLLSTLESFKTETAFTEYLLPKLAANVSSSLPSLRHELQQLKSQAASEIARIKKVIFDKLQAFQPEQASSLYLNLIKELTEVYGPSSFSIVTTNYDLTFESTFESDSDKWKDLGISDVDYGFSIQFGRPLYDATRDFDWSESVVEYQKLHGSLDWHRDSKGRCGRSMSSTVPDDPDQMAILYPGFKGVPEAEPFISMHGRLNRRLAQSDAVIVIGFAFRDAYINNIFENALRLRPDLELIYFNPLKIDKFPPNSLVPHFINNYPLFRYIDRGIGLTEKSLDLAAIVAP